MIKLSSEFTNVNLNYLLEHPWQIGECCFEIRRKLSDDEYPVPKSFFANLLNCQVRQLAQIENGIVLDTHLAIRYLLKLHQVYKLFNP